jgi:phage gp45-like
MDAAYKEMSRLQDKLLDFKATVINDAGSVTGICVQPKPGETVKRFRSVRGYGDKKRTDEDLVIAVLPHGGVEYTEAAMSADAVIIAAGGATCHLATVTREIKRGRSKKAVQGITMMMDPDAMRKYVPGATVALSPSLGEISIYPIVKDAGNRLYYFGKDE